MNRFLMPGLRSGVVAAQPSKSELHRLLLSGALSPEGCRIFCETLSADIQATADCLRGLGADLRFVPAPGGGWKVGPLPGPGGGKAVLPCGESGTTLRFLLPVAGALGYSGTFLLSGNLQNRPLTPLLRTLSANGMSFSLQGGGLCFSGQLKPGVYTVPGDISSQFVSGLLYALPLLSGDSLLRVTGHPVSRGYVALTEKMLSRGHIIFEKTVEGYRVPGKQCFRAPETVRPGGDWTNAAPFFCMGALSPDGITVTGLDSASLQGDAVLPALLEAFGARVCRTPEGVTVSRGTLRGQVVDAADIPDLVPALSVLGALSGGTTEIVAAARLRGKESDRLQTTAALLRALGGQAEETPEGLRITGTQLFPGGAADGAADHRIAMAAAVAACGCRNGVLVKQAECVKKSYPDFWRDFDRLERKE